MEYNEENYCTKCGAQVKDERDMLDGLCPQCRGVADSKFKRRFKK